MSAERDLNVLLHLIMYEATKVVEADRSTLFIHDRARGELWSKVAQGSTTEIRFPVGSGIAGTVAQTGETININDAYADKRFNRNIDLSSGYRTKTILCCPMRNAMG